jgi:hypothetical protein
MKSDRAVTASYGSAVIDDVIRAINDHKPRPLRGLLRARGNDRAKRRGGVSGPNEIRDRYSATFSSFPNMHVEAQGRPTLGHFFVQEKTVIGRSDPAPTPGRDLI